MASASVCARIIELLRSLQEARELWDGRSGGGRVRLMPSQWAAGSYVELERAMHHMYGGDHGRVVPPPYLRERAAVAVRPDGQPSQGTAAHAERIGLRERPSGPRAGNARCDDNAMTHPRGERQGIPVFGLGEIGRGCTHSEGRLERALASRLVGQIRCWA